jgi:DNA-binding transcriptional LysR family regulator
MGIALLPRSVLSTFPESRRLTVHRLPTGENRAETVLIWRKGTTSPNIQALQDILSRSTRS